MKTTRDIERAEIVTDTQTTQRVVESMVLRGDISALSPEERAKFYLQMCESLGLSAASQPFALLKLNGKEVLYPTRGATDQLAAHHRLSRRIVEGPEVRDFGGTKLLFCRAEVTHPNGRVETAIATLPARIDENSLMKLETKAKRRATLSILGLGMLDESEIESIPAGASSTAEAIRVTVTESVSTEIPLALGKVRDAIAELGGADLTADQAAAVWVDHYAEIVAAGLQDRAGEMLEMALAPRLKTRFKELLRQHEGKVAADKRLEHDRARIRGAATVAELEAVRGTLSKELFAVLTEDLWLRRIALCATIGELAGLLPKVRELKAQALRERVERAVTARQRELRGEGPEGGPGGAPAPGAETPMDEDPEREAIVGEGSPLPAAIARLHGCQGPKHCVSHYLAHRDELAVSERGAYRQALLTHLAQRYPHAVPTRDRAEQLVAEGEAESVRRAA